ncbi:MAG: hypothetical protein ACTHZ9_11835 [Leucobacter sp.]
MTKRRPLALGAAAAIGFGSLFFAAPALAEEAASLPVTDQTEEQALAAEESTGEAKTSEGAEDSAQLSDEEAAALEETLTENAEKTDVTVSAAGVTGAGDLVVVTVEEDGAVDASDPVVADLLAAVEEGTDRDVTHKTTSEIGTPLAANDVVGGAGYLSLQGTAIESGCSIGFTGWTPEREPALITAGHCTNDGGYDNIALSIPSEQPAHLGAGAGNDQWLDNGTGILGQFGFSQFGGPGNADAQDQTAYPGEGNTVDSTDSSDIAVVDVSGDFNLSAQVTDWSTAGQDDLAAGATDITSVGDPTQGAVSKSGRTTGLTSSTIGSGDILDGFQLMYASVENPSPEHTRWVRGFQAYGLEVAGGDSGGAVFQGEKAVGVVSGHAGADDEEYLWATSLTHGVGLTGGYEVAIHIDAPEVTSHTNGAELESGETITGTAPSNAEEVSVSTAPSSGSSVPVEDGTWSITAPTEPGDYTLSYSAMNGMSSSESVEFNFTVEEESNVERPVVTSPANGSTVAPLVETIEGTGIPGAELTMTGDVNSNVTVGEDGNWSVPTSLDVGSYSISVFQTVDEVNSNTVRSSFTVEEEGGEIAPIEITSISDGDEFALSDAPTSVSGTAEPGETVVVDVQASGGAGAATSESPAEPLAVEVGEDGSWTHALEYVPVLGSFTLSYGYEGAGSGDSLSFALVEDNGSETPPPGEDEDPPGDDGGNNGGDGNGGDDELAETGLDTISLLPYIGAAAAMLLLGTAVTLFAARRQKGGNATE